jgi:enoyl-CoA hydratase/carnithine racemase
MSYRYLLCERDSGIGKIAMNRPGLMNALNPEMLYEFQEALGQAGKDEEVAVVIITGAGSAFSAGVDLAFLGERKLENGRVGPVLDGPANSVIDAIQTIPKAVIAAVNGHCYAGALEIALACDLIIASEDARFGDTHVRWGLRPSWGMSQRLPCAVGYAKARELSFTADAITARQAESIGLVNWVVPANKLQDAAVELAKRIISNSLQAVAAYKHLYNQTLRNMLQTGLDLEAQTEFRIGDTGSRIGGFGRRK